MEFVVSPNIDLSGIDVLSRNVETLFGSKSFSAQAVEDAGDYLTATWIRIADARLKHSAGGYRNAIQQGRQYPYEDNPLHYVVENKHVAVLYLEKGYDAFDMKKILQTSAKVRISKKGKKYIIIPFQHGTPGTSTLSPMPQAIYSLAKGLDPTVKRLTTGKTRWGESLSRSDVDFNVSGYGRRTKVYSFGAYKQAGLFPGMSHEVGNPQFSGKFSGGYTWKASPYEGMYRIKTKGGGSVYMTFRVMSEDSQGWIHPAQPALHIAEDAFKEAKPNILQILAAGVQQDLASLKIGTP